MLVRRERAGDVAAIREVVDAAFRQDDGEPLEPGLVDALRADPGWIPQLSLVVLSPAGEIVGHVVCTRATLAGHDVLGLGPLAVAPVWQRRGVGSALMHAVLAAAEARGETLVGVLGSPGYYGRFGFRPAIGRGVLAPDPAWGEHFQVRVLGGDETLGGTFRYAAPFERL